MLSHGFGLKAQQRGLYDSVLVSNGRPTLALVPAATLILVNSGWCSLSPDTPESINGGAKLWFSQYEHGTASLVFALAEADDPWQWPHSGGTRYTFLRQHKREYKGQNLQEATFVLAAGADPFSTMASTQSLLVRRTTLLQAFRKVQIIVEYREPVQAGSLPLEDDLPLLAAFEQRARASFSLRLKDAGDAIPTDIQSLEKAPQAMSRLKLATWTGPLFRQGNL